MANLVIQILALYTATLFLSVQIKNAKASLIFSSLLSILIILEVTSVYLTGNLIDYRAYSHFNFREISDWAPLFKTEMAFFFLAYIITSASHYKITNLLKRKMLLNNRMRIPVIIILITIMSVPNGIFSEFYKIYEMVTVKSESLKNALSSLNISSDSYIQPHQVEATKGKNIIVISLESIEQGYISPYFKEVTPNLTQLSKELTYYSNFPESPGSKWTSASLYTHQVGMPAFFKGSGNEFFQNSSEVQLTGLSHVLNKAGYQTTYFMGNPESAGIKDILTAYSIDIMSEDSFGTKYPDYNWGLHDYDLFNEAKVAIKDLRRQDEPFAFFMSTISTHFPKGIFDKRMKNLVTEKDNSLEFSVASLDYLMGDFITFLENEKILDNTAIFIFPDHLLMGSKNKTLDKLKQSPRQLFLLTNVPEEKLPKKTTETIYQIDLPRIILNGSEVKSNAKFLTDYITTDDTISYLNSNRAKLTALNAASLKRENYKKGITVSHNSNEIIISSGNTRETIKLEDNTDVHAVKLLFNKDMVFIKKRTASLENLFFIKPSEINYIQLIIKKDTGSLMAYLGNIDKIGLAKNNKNNISFSTNEINKIIQSNNTLSKIKTIHSSPTKYTPSKPTVLATKTKKQNLNPNISTLQLSTEHNSSSLIKVTSSEYITSLKIPSQISYKNRTTPLKRGLSILEMVNGKIEFENFDTHGSESDMDTFLDRLESLSRNNNFYVIAAHDSAAYQLGKHRTKLKQLGLMKLAELRRREAYVAYRNCKAIPIELSSYSSITINLPDKCNSNTINNSIYTSIDLKNNQLIAHAGGEIEGAKYTNTLEALNHSYKTGFRLFELDIIKTSDNVYVAAHDWKHWAHEANYKGITPPTRAIFKKHKIRNRYNTLDIYDINEWFRNHPDAILVTDKVNDPIDFSNKFIDKNRLMMELFSLHAVKQGISANIKSAMPSWSVITQLKGDKLKTLLNLGVTDIAASRNIIKANKQLLIDLKRHNINIYAFHVNFEKGKDENYVFCNEVNYIYGIYADIWNFDTPAICSNAQEIKRVVNNI